MYPYICEEVFLELDDSSSFHAEVMALIFLGLSKTMGQS